MTFLPGQSLLSTYALIKNPINRLRLYQFLRTKTTEANKSLKTDANGALIGFLMSRQTGHYFTGNMKKCY